MIRRAVAVIALSGLGCAVQNAATRPAQVTRAAATEISPTTTIRVNIINLTTQPAPFIFRFGGVQQLDTIAPPGSLGLPVFARTLQAVPGLYRIELIDRKNVKVAHDSLQAGEKGSNFSTIELIFDTDGWSLTTCHCSRVYGRGGLAGPRANR